MMAESPPTLFEVQRHAPWLWVWCDNRDCLHRAPIALAPVIIRWGLTTSSDRLRQNARCTCCGRLGASLQVPSWGNTQIGWAAFPADRMTHKPARRLLGFTT